MGQYPTGTSGVCQNTEHWILEAEAAIDEIHQNNLLPAPDGIVVGIEYSTGVGKIPVVGKYLEKVVQRVSSGYVAPSSTRGMELVWHRNSGRMGAFFYLGNSGTVGKDVGGGYHIAIYAGGIYNLESVEDYAHPANLTKYLNDAQTYTRYNGTITRGPYGATLKHAANNNTDTSVATAGYAFGKSAQASTQSIRVVPAGDTIRQVLDLASRYAGYAVWNFRGSSGSLNDYFRRKNNVNEARRFIL